MHRSEDESSDPPSVEKVSAKSPVVGILPESDGLARDSDTGSYVAGAKRGSIGGDVLNVVRGFCMGAADTVPGVSGGTIALILGHYQRLIMAISHIDTHLVSLILSGSFRKAADHCDFRFLAALGGGILLGFATLAGVMHWLLANRMPETLAVFLGLVVASVWVVRGHISRWQGPQKIACVSGAIAAFVISQLPTGANGFNLPYLFFAATIAICAMILPGISGAFVLLLLGVYHQVTFMVKNTVKGDFTSENFINLAVFALGCLTGLLAFSRLLRWLLLHYRDTTMSVLMGLMIGSVARLWPLQQPTPESVMLDDKFHVMQFVPPNQWQGSLWILAALAAGAAVTVVVVERFAERFPSGHERAAADRADVE